nr:ABC transporter ATP-binding protein [uncultured Treponema sp.]
MAFISIENISFSYSKKKVIENFSLQVEKGTFTTLLGESGCGKTTILKLLSGFLEPSNGKIIINDKVINGVLPNKRKIGMVFQDYALFPHMTVEQNLLYGLKLTKEQIGKKAVRKSKEEMKSIVSETAASLGIEDLLERFPSELSGGQQQRVALGRAIVLKPDMLLMDEPLSSLDTKLRIKVREELKDIQKKLGITTIYVTHDQEEALSLSDKIAVIKNGTLVQFGTPSEVYFEPADKFVADFVGRVNILTDKETKKEYMIRPEWFSISKEQKESSYKGKILSTEFLGAYTRYKVEFENEKQIITVDNSDSENDFTSGDSVYLTANKIYNFKHE